MYVSIKSCQYKQTDRVGPRASSSTRQVHQGSKAGLTRGRKTCVTVEAVKHLPDKVTINDLQQLKKEELKDELRARQLVLGGNKGELVERLWECMEQQQIQAQRSKSSPPLESKQSPKQDKTPSALLNKNEAPSGKKGQTKTQKDEKPEIQLKAPKQETQSAATTKKQQVSETGKKPVASQKDKKVESKQVEEESTMKISTKSQKPPTQKKIVEKKIAEGEPTKSQKSSQVVSQPAALKKAKPSEAETEQKTSKKLQTKQTKQQPGEEYQKYDTQAKKQPLKKEEPPPPRRVVIKKTWKAELNAAKDVVKIPPQLQVPPQAHKMIQEKLQQHKKQVQSEQEKEAWKPPLKKSVKIEKEEEEEEEEIVPIESLQEKLKQQQLEDKFIMEVAKEKLQEQKLEKRQEQLQAQKVAQKKKQLQAQRSPVKKAVSVKEVESVSETDQQKPLKAKKGVQKEEEEEEEESLKKAVSKKEVTESVSETVQQKPLKAKEEENEIEESPKKAVSKKEVAQKVSKTGQKKAKQDVVSDDLVEQLEAELRKKSTRTVKGLPWIAGKSAKGMEQFKSYKAFEKFCEGCTAQLLYLSCRICDIPKTGMHKKKSEYLQAIWNAFMVKKTHSLPKQGEVQEEVEDSTETASKIKSSGRQRRKAEVQSPKSDSKAASSDASEQEGREVDLRVSSAGGSAPYIVDVDDVTLQQDYSKDLELETEEEKFDDQPDYMVRRPEGGISVFKESLEGPISNEVSAEGNKDMDFEYHENQRDFSLMDSTAGYHAFSDDDVDIQGTTTEQGDTLVWTQSDEEDFEIEIPETVDQVGEDTLGELDNLEIEQQILHEDALSEEEILETEEKEEEAQSKGGKAQLGEVEKQVEFEPENLRGKSTTKSSKQQSKQVPKGSDEETTTTLDDYQRKWMGMVSRTPDITDSEGEEEEQEVDSSVSSSDQEEEKVSLIEGTSSDSVKIKTGKDIIDFEFADVELKEAGEQIAKEIREEIKYKEILGPAVESEDIKQGEIIAQQFREKIKNESKQSDVQKHPYDQSTKTVDNTDKKKSDLEIQQQENFSEWILNVQNSRTQSPVSWYDNKNQIEKPIRTQQLDYQGEQQKYMKNVLQRMSDEYDVTFREQKLDLQNSNAVKVYDQYLEEQKIQSTDEKQNQTDDATIAGELQNLQKIELVQSEQLQKQDALNQSLQKPGENEDQESTEVDSENANVTQENVDEDQTLKISPEQKSEKEEEKDTTMKISKQDTKKSQDVFQEGLKMIGKFFKPFL